LTFASRACGWVRSECQIRSTEAFHETNCATRIGPLVAEDAAKSGLIPPVLCAWIDQMRRFRTCRYGHATCRVDLRWRGCRRREARRHPHQRPRASDDTKASRPRRWLDQWRAFVAPPSAGKPHDTISSQSARAAKGRGPRRGHRGPRDRSDMRSRGRNRKRIIGSMCLSKRSFEDPAVTAVTEGAIASCERNGGAPKKGKPRRSGAPNQWVIRMTAS